MSKIKKCCNNKDCQHEFTVNYDKSTGWVISTNSPVWAKIMQEAEKETAPLSQSNYAIFQTHDIRAVRNLISELEK